MPINYDDNQTENLQRIYEKKCLTKGSGPHCYAQALSQIQF